MYCILYSEPWKMYETVKHTVDNNTKAMPTIPFYIYIYFENKIRSRFTRGSVDNHKITIHTSQLSLL